MSKFITERRHHNLFELKMQDETFTSNQRQDDIERSLKGQHSQKDRLPLQYSSTHIVKPALMWCLCGIWQDTLLPCRHACAVYCLS